MAKGKETKITSAQMLEQVMVVEKRLEGVWEKLESYRMEAEHLEEYVGLLKKLHESHLSLEMDANGVRDSEDGEGDCKPVIKARQGKWNTNLYERVLREYGEPMHLTDLLDASLKKGLVQTGTAKPKDQLRVSLQSSAKFRNLGGNMWWIEGVPAPGEEADSEGERLVA